MKLEKFRVTNYRSVKDSGWIAVSGRTVLVGGNESGKTNLLLALRALNSSETHEPLSVTRDFPADRLRSEYSEDLDVVQTVWSLSDEEREGLADIFPRAAGVTQVEIGRGYEPERWVRFLQLPPAEAPVAKAKQLFEHVLRAASGDEALSDPAWQRALAALGAAVGPTTESAGDWTAGVTEALGGLQQPLQLAQIALADDARAALEEIADLTAQIANDSEYENAARQWLLRRLPSFHYLDEYPQIEGHQNLAEFVQRQREKRPNPGDEYFAMLLRVAGIDPEGLDALLHADAETRRQMASRAGAVLTRTLRELWSDRALKVRFNLDGEHLDVLVADPTALYDVEVNLNERSRGFLWFFSFYVLFAASTQAGTMDEAILLLDEPGLHLHAIGQKDLLKHLAHLPHQVILATQSPFLVPADDLSDVRSVNFSDATGTIVADAPAGDEKTLTPVLHALGAEVAKSLFGSDPHLVVAEITDYWYLRALSHFLAEQGSPALPVGLQVTPAGGAAALPYLLGLLTPQRVQTILLLNEPPGAGRIATDLLEARPLQHESLVFIAAGLPTAPSEGADVEDLLDAEMYDRFCRFAYRRELKDKALEPNEAIPRLIRRYEDAFGRLGLEFSRARPARLILRGAAQNPQSLFPKQTCENFERLFGAIRDKFKALGR